MSIEGEDNFQDPSSYLYERQQAVKSKQRRLRDLTREPREVRLRVGIAEEDLQRKVAEARRLLGEGSVVRVRILFDSAIQAERGETVLDRVVKALATDATLTEGPAKTGRGLVALLRPT